MDSPTSDLALGQQVRAASTAVGYSPAAFIMHAQDSLERQRLIQTAHFPPFPALKEELTLGPEHFSEWPEWTAELIGPECRLERLRWPDDTVVTRLLSRRALVLGAHISHAPSS